MSEKRPMIARLALGGLLVAGCSGGSSQPNSAPTSQARPSATASSTTTAPHPKVEASPSSEKPSPHATHAGRAAIKKEVIITFYGAYDNDPPGSRAVAHTNIQSEAGGTGTYKDPLTMAARSDVSKEFKPGTKVYVPFLRKYFERADDCGESAFAPNGCDTQLDLYMGNPSRKKAVLDCEDALTPDGKKLVIINPPPNLAVSKQPLWSDKTGQCFDR